MCWLTFPSFKLDFFSHLLQVLNKTGLGLGGCPPPEMIFKGQGGWGLANHDKHMLGPGGGVAHRPVRMEGAQQARAPPWARFGLLLLSAWASPRFPHPAAHYGCDFCSHKPRCHLLLPSLLWCHPTDGKGRMEVAQSWVWHSGCIQPAVHQSRWKPL